VYRDLQTPGAGHPGIVHDVHHAVHHYRSVASSVYMTLYGSIAVCLAFALLAITQLLLGLKLSRGGGKGMWLYALVPAAVARCCSLLLLIWDLQEAAGGAMATKIFFLYEASTFFDATSSWAFYTSKIACILAWVVHQNGGGEAQMEGYARTGVLCSLCYAMVLGVTVSMSLRFGSLCVETANPEDCALKKTWQATFHVATALFSFSSFLHISVLAVPLALRPPSPSWIGDGGWGILRMAAVTCVSSLAWWALFDFWGCLVAFDLVTPSPGQTEINAAVNLLLSELAPSCAIAGCLFLQAVREARVPGRGSSSSRASAILSMTMHGNEELVPMKEGGWRD